MQSIQDQLLVFAAAQRDQAVALSNAGADDDLPPEQRCNRAIVDPGCLLKFGDQVEVFGMTAIYLCPGRGVTTFMAVTVDGADIMVQNFETQHVTDRIPAEPSEQPMPIYETP